LWFYYNTCTILHTTSSPLTSSNKPVQIISKKQIKVKEQHFYCFYCCSTFHSHSRVFNNEHNTYPKRSVSARFTYRLDRLKPRASIFRGSPVKVYNIFNTVIGLSHLCCHNVLYFLNNPSGIFLTQLHSISEYSRILNTPHHLCLY